MDTPSAAMRISAAHAQLEAELEIPDSPRGIVLFAHGSGSGRHSPRNRSVAATMRAAGLATLLTDLLTPAEVEYDARTGALRFDVELLGARVTGLVDAVTEDPRTAGLGVGLFGASTGAAAALVAAAARPAAVRAVVSRGGRPDLAPEATMRRLRAPTLLVVGERDPAVAELNRTARRALGGPSRLEVIPYATHLFEERGTLELAAELARDWFVAHLPPWDRSPGDDPSADRW